MPTYEKSINNFNLTVNPEKNTPPTGWSGSGDWSTTVVKLTGYAFANAQTDVTNGDFIIASDFGAQDITTDHTLVAGNVYGTNIDLTEANMTTNHTAIAAMGLASTTVSWDDADPLTYCKLFSDAAGTNTYIALRRYVGADNTSYSGNQFAIKNTARDITTYPIDIRIDAHVHNCVGDVDQTVQTPWTGALAAC